MKSARPMASIIIPQAEEQPTKMTSACIETLGNHHRGLILDIQLLTGVSNIYQAWNMGARQAKTRFCIFLNNDTLTCAPWILRLLQPLKSEAVSGVASRIERCIPERLRQIVGRSFLQGWCFACERDTWRETRFDEEFQLYFGDTDFMARLPRPFAHLPHLQDAILHAGHATAKRRPDRHAVWLKDRETFIRKWSETCSSNKSTQTQT